MDGPTAASTSLGPDVLLFKRFGQSLSSIVKSNHRTRVDDVTEDVRVSMLEFIQQIHQKHHKYDYHELLELAIFFLGRHPSSTRSFISHSGAVSHARWMAKAIYAFKIYLFQDQFELTRKEKNSIKRLCIFLVRVYLQAWFLAPLAVKAPYHDYKFLQKLIECKEVDPEISNCAVKKFANHLWYLSPETAAFASLMM
jgi:hypothetical protein